MIPKAQLKERPLLGKTLLASNTTITEDDINWYSTFEYDDLLGDDIITTNFGWQYFTDTGFTTEIKYQLLNEKNDVVKEVSVVYTAIGPKTLYPVKVIKVEKDERKSTVSGSATSPLIEEVRTTRAANSSSTVNEKIRLEGVTFELKKENVTVETGTTNSQGEVIFYVEPGEYQLIETEAKAGYVLNSTPINVVVTNQVVEQEVENKKIKGTIKVTKVDSEHDKITLPNVTFMLKKGNDVIQEQKTDKDGIATFENVEYGDYTIVEKETISGYILDDTPVDVTIQTDGEVVTKTIKNMPRKGSITVKKVDAEDAKLVLSGVKFELHKAGNKINESVTNADGEIVFNNLPYGEYQLIETEAKTGYELNKEPVNVLIAENHESEVVTVKNKKFGLGNIKIVKVDEDDATVKLAGVTFELRKDGKTIQERTTNNYGETSFENIEHGDYTLVETHTKDGYVLNATPVEVRVDQSKLSIY